MDEDVRRKGRLALQLKAQQRKADELRKCGWTVIEPDKTSDYLTYSDLSNIFRAFESSEHYRNYASVAMTRRTARSLRAITCPNGLPVLDNFLGDIDLFGYQVRIDDYQDSLFVFYVGDNAIWWVENQ